MIEYFKTAAEAMVRAYNLSKDSGRRVFRHQIENKWGQPLWAVSFDRTPPESLQGLTA